MKKTFSFNSAKHKPPRVVESIKAEIRKYLKRERRKPLPEGVDYWDFDCKMGEPETEGEVIHVSQINEMIDQAAARNWDAIYIEILAKQGIRQKQSESEASDEK